MSLIIPANTLASGGYAVDNSCRFNDGSSDYMHKTPSSAGNLRTWTFSTWFKRSNISLGQKIFSVKKDASNSFESYFNTNDTLAFYHYSSNGGVTDAFLGTDQVFRDTSAWYHIVFSVDTTQGTASNRVKMYVNGEQVTSLSTAIYFNQDYDTYIDSANENRIGANLNNSVSQFFDGYLAETVLIDGQQLDATSFGEFDSDSSIWKPISVSGLTFGTNGFHLDYQDSANLGNDANGGTDFTEVNLTAIDQTTDTPTNNFITLNPLIGYTSQTDNQVYSEGNTIIIPNSTDNYGTGSSTIGLKGGKWYWEAQIVWNGTSNNANFPRTIGFCTENYLFNYSYLGQDGESWGIIFADAATDIWRLEHGGSSGDISGATTMANGGTMNLALDLDNGKFYVGYGGSWFTSGDPTSGATGTGAIATLDATDLSKYIFPAVTNSTNSTYYKFNFGNPAYAISSGNTDGNDRGNFEFTVPDGYLSICTANLSEVLG